jgi:hypothetical protein
MIRRGLAVIVVTAAAVLGLPSTADAGELCITLLPTFGGARICIPTL